MIYEIAGLKVEIEPEFERLKRQCDSYKSFGEPVMRLNPRIYEETACSPQNRSDEDKEYIFASAQFCSELIWHGRFFLHASAVVYNDEAYLFSARSGTGKSSHTAHWLKEFDGSYILNDDKPVIFPQNEGVSVFGTPFAGKTDLHVNKKLPLRGVCFLKQGEENKITRISDEKAIALTLNNTYRPKNAEGMNLLLDMIERVVKQTDMFEMSCRNEPASSHISYNAMKGK